MGQTQMNVLVEAFAYAGVLYVGLRIFGDSFQVLFEKWIKSLLRSISHNVANSFGVGFALTLFVQSSSVATLSAMGLANAGLLNFSQLLSFNLGSFLAGTVMTWFFANFLYLSPVYFMTSGLLLWAVFRREKFVEVGRVLFGIGLVLFGLINIATFADNLELNTQTLFFEKSVMVAFGTALMAAFVFRSALVVLLFIIGLSSGQFVGLEVALGWVLGVAIGSSLANVREGLRLNRVPRRVALILFTAKLVLTMGFFLLHADLVASTKQFFAHWSLPFLIVLFYSVFNLLVILVAVPISSVVQRASRAKSGQGAKKEPQRLAIVGGVGTLAPTLAIEQGWQELAKLAAMTETIMTLTRDFLRFTQVKEEDLKRIRKYEKITNNIQGEISEFLRIVTRTRLSGQQARVIRSIVNISDELELISDHCLRLVEMRLAAGWEQDHKLGSLFDSVVKDYEGVFTQLTSASEPLVLKGRESLVEFMKVDGELAAKYHIASIHNSVKNLKS